MMQFKKGLEYIADESHYKEVLSLVGKAKQTVWIGTAGITLGMFTKDKVKSMKGMKQMMIQFQQRNGATQCKLLKGVGTKVVVDIMVQQTPELHKMKIHIGSLSKSDM